MEYSPQQTILEGWAEIYRLNKQQLADDYVDPIDRPQRAI